MMFNKFLVVTASADGVRNPGKLGQLLRRMRVPQDILLSRGPLDVLDHAAPEMGLGGKLAVDLTDTVPDSAADAVVSSAVWTFCGGVEAVDGTVAETWGGLWLFAGRDGIDVASFLQRNGVAGIRWVVVLDREMEGFSYDDRLWIASSNCDPLRDVKIEDGIAVLDARIKAGGVNGFARRWPNVVASSAETVARVDTRWNEYGLGEFVESPSVKYGALQKRAGAEY